MLPLNINNKGESIVYVKIAPLVEFKVPDAKNIKENTTKLIIIKATVFILLRLKIV